MDNLNENHSQLSVKSNNMFYKSLVTYKHTIFSATTAEAKTNNKKQLVPENIKCTGIILHSHVN